MSLLLEQEGFPSSLAASFAGLRQDSAFTDVTLACEDGTQLEAHRVVLATSSTFFLGLLGKARHPHPLVYMRGLSPSSLFRLLDFLYLGEARVEEEQVEGFLTMAAELGVRGTTGHLLAGGAGERNQEEAPAESPADHQHQTVGEVMVKGEDIIRDNFENKSTLMEADSFIEGFTIVSENKKGATRNSHKRTHLPPLPDLDAQIYTNMTKLGPYWHCNFCDKKSADKPRIKNHLEYKHMNLEFPCDGCDKVYTTRDYLRGHKNRQCKSRVSREVERASSHECGQCGDSFDSTSTGAEHTCIALRKDLPNEVISIVTDNKDNATKREYEELNVKIYQNMTKIGAFWHCNLCDKTNKDKARIKNHLEYKHMNLEFPCDKCDKVFSNRDSLGAHQRTNRSHGFKVVMQEKISVI